MIEDVRPPLRFRQLQTANLIGWQGHYPNQGFDRLVRDLATHFDPGTDRAPVEKSELAVPRARLAPTSGRSTTIGSPNAKLIIGITVAILLLSAGGYLWTTRPAALAPERVGAGTATAPTQDEGAQGSPSAQSAGPSNVDDARPAPPKSALSSEQESTAPAIGETSSSPTGDPKVPRMTGTSSSLREPSSFKITLISLGVSEDRFDTVFKGVLLDGYRQREGMYNGPLEEAYTENHPFLKRVASRPTVLYYDESTASEAKRLAEVLRQLTGDKFDVARGGGHGITQPLNQFAVHWIRPRR